LILTKIQVLCKKFPLEFCISDEICSKYFQKCLEDQFCSENFEFYKIIQKFQNEFDSMKLKELSNEIILKYFNNESKSELNIKEDLKLKCKLKMEEILKENQEISNDFFDEVLKNVMLMLKIEEYSKFLTSRDFKEYYLKHGIDKIDSEHDK
jgi:hypothetical protein